MLARMPLERQRAGTPHQPIPIGFGTYIRGGTPHGSRQFGGGKGLIGRKALASVIRRLSGRRTAPSGPLLFPGLGRCSDLRPRLTLANESDRQQGCGTQRAPLVLDAWLPRNVVTSIPELNRALLAPIPQRHVPGAALQEHREPALAICADPALKRIPYGVLGVLHPTRESGRCLGSTTSIGMSGKMSLPTKYVFFPVPGAVPMATRGIKSSSTSTVISAPSQSHRWVPNSLLIVPKRGHHKVAGAPPGVLYSRPRRRKVYFSDRFTRERLHENHRHLEREVPDRHSSGRA